MSNIRQSVIRPLRPKNINPTEWYSQPFHNDAYCWDHKSGFRMISALEVVEDAKNPEVNGPHYHVSMSMFVWPSGASQPSGPHRINSQDAAWRLRHHFPDYAGWEEDNHVPDGKVRNFWRPVDESKVGQECFCKQHEPAIREDKGDFVWRPAK